MNKKTKKVEAVRLRGSVNKFEAKMERVAKHPPMPKPKNIRAR